MPGFSDVLKLMSHAKELQAAAEAMKSELPKMEFTATGANGGLTVTVGGDLTVRKINIDPALPGDAAYLAQELTIAVNSAMASAKTAMQDKMKGVTGELGIELPTL